MRKTVDTRPLFLLGRKRAPHAYKGLVTRLGRRVITSSCPKMVAGKWLELVVISFVFLYIFMLDIVRIFFNQLEKCPLLFFKNSLL